MAIYHQITIPLNDSMIITTHPGFPVACVSVVHEDAGTAAVHRKDPSCRCRCRSACLSTIGELHVASSARCNSMAELMGCKFGKESLDLLPQRASSDRH